MGFGTFVWSVAWDLCVGYVSFGLWSFLWGLREFWGCVGLRCVGFKAR